MKLTGLTHAEATKSEFTEESLTPIPESERYVPTVNATPQVSSKGQPTIYGNQVLTSNIEELRREFNIES